MATDELESHFQGNDQSLKKFTDVLMNEAEKRGEQLSVGVVRDLITQRQRIDDLESQVRELENSLRVSRMTAKDTRDKFEDLHARVYKIRHPKNPDAFLLFHTTVSRDEKLLAVGIEDKTEALDILSAVDMMTKILAKGEFPAIMLANPEGTEKVSAKK